jgi:hypothetical protein
MLTLVLVLVLIYMALMISLTLMVRRSYVRRRDWAGPKCEDLERGIRPPYSPPPERRTRAFDWSSELKPIKNHRNS